MFAGGLSPSTFFLDITGPSRVGFVSDPSATTDKYLVEAMGGGVAMLDADGDGKLDIFFVNGAALRTSMKQGDRPDKSDPRFWNRLYRNNGDGSFTDITAKAGLQGVGYGQGVAVGDYDNDGRPDLYVTGFGGNTLYRNLGNGTFENVTAKAGVEGSGWSTSAGFIDYDRDGLLDLFVIRYLDWGFEKNKWCGDTKPGMRSYCHPDQFAPVTHLLYRNLGGGRFKETSVEAGITKAPGKGLGVAFNDADRDGWPDFFVANDSFPQQLFRNLHNGKFEEIGLPLGVAYDEDGKVFAGMGADFNDYDNDGWPDIFVNALANQGYGLFRNRKTLFEYASVPSGVAATSKMHSGWGTHFVDFDNDGWKDIFVAQGHVLDNIELTQPGLHYRETPLLLRNAGGKFIDVSASSGSAFTTPMAGRGAAFGDLDNDGAIDIVVSSNRGAPRILMNAAKGNGWLLIDTIGTKSNRDGIGASVRIVTPSGREQFGFVSSAGSYLSAHDKRVHFGLGNEKRVRLLEIRWPSGIVQTWTEIAANQIFVAKEAEK